jgi:hypothetical protein
MEKYSIFLGYRQLLAALMYKKRCKWRSLLLAGAKKTGCCLRIGAKIKVHIRGRKPS